MNESFENSWLPKALELAGKDAPAVCYDKSVSIYKRMLAIMPVLNQKGEMWKIFYAKEENSWKMNDTYSNFKSWNNNQSESILEIPEYCSDYRQLCPAIKQPVLFYYRTTDWAIGPEHFKGVNFPNNMLWRGEVGHLPFPENKEDLMKAITSYQSLYKF